MKFVVAQSKKLKPSIQIAAFIAGMLLALAFAPYNYLIFAYVSPLILFYLIALKTPQHSFKIVFLFALGLYIAGAHWLYNSVYDYGINSVLAASVITGIGLILLSIVWALPWLIWSKLLNNSNNLYTVFGFIGIWVLCEWYRSFAFGGYTWFNLGYSAVDYIIAKWGQLFGVYFVSFVILVQAFGCAFLITQKSKIQIKIIVASTITFLFLIPYLITSTATTSAINVALVQPNIGITENRTVLPRQKLATLVNISKDYKHSDLIVFPESTEPRFIKFPQLSITAQGLKQSLVDAKTSVIFGGINIDQQRRVTNSAYLLDSANNQIYNKMKLVAFGEYVPFAKILGKLLDLFNLPHSSISAYSRDTHFVLASGITILPLICYEIAFPRYVSKAATASNLIVNISNDAWFGASNGPHQHLQIARFRAIETGKTILRVATTGITAIIDSSGDIIKQLPQATAGVINLTIKVNDGSSFYSRNGNFFIFSICGVFLLLSFYLRVRFRNHIPNSI